MEKRDSLERKKRIRIIKSQLLAMKTWLEEVDDLEELKRLLRGAIWECEMALEYLREGR